MDETKICYIFGRNVLKYRKNLGMTQEELANRAGINRSYLGGIERGNRNVSLSTVAILSKALGVQPAALFETDNY